MGFAPLERTGVKGLLLLSGLMLASCCSAIAESNESEPTAKVIVVVGAPGEEEYQTVFQKAAQLWEKACQQAPAPCLTIGLDQARTNDLEQLRLCLEAEPKEGGRELWLVLIGHGTFDSKEAKFNLRGPDVSATNLATWLEPFHRPVAVINTSSSSSPFLKELSHTNRVVISATRSGYEQNFTRFGQYLSEAIADLSADLDKDGQVSLLEAFLHSAHTVAEFYKTEGRLATEHPLIDDNGDGLGTPPDWFRGVRAVKRAADGAALDGLRAHQFHLIRSDAERKLSPDQRERRNELERAIEELRGRKENLKVDDYYQQLESLLLDLARVYASEGPVAKEDK